MNPPTDYYQWCGPRALAAILGTSAHRTASSLWHAQQLRGRITAPSSSPADCVLVLAADGYRISEHATSRALPLVELRGHAELLSELIEAFHRDAGMPPPEPKPAPEPLPAHIERRCAEYAARSKAVELLTLRELVDLAPTGTWLIVCSASPVLGALDRHALALIEGQIVAGDTPDLAAYGQAAVEVAYRIEPPTQEENRR